MWFQQQFVPADKKHLATNNLPRKVVLMLNNPPSHPASIRLKNEDLKVLFLPAKVSSLCQPMDQGVLDALKKKYWQKKILAIVDNEDYIHALKEVELLNMIQWVSEG